MSKAIRITPEAERELREAFEEEIRSAKLADGTFRFSMTLSEDVESSKARVVYTLDAWRKQCAVLREFDKEVAWHGVAHRAETGDVHEYIVTDILLYPQTVTATTVEMDEEAYAKWIADNAGDERMWNIHMQAHSHVNMGTSPSSVDLAHQEEILRMLPPDGFYIFLIWNKSLSVTAKIYDLEKNIMFEDRDIKVLAEGAEEIDAFISEAKRLVTNRTYCGSYYTTPGTASSNTPKEEPSQSKERVHIGAGWNGWGQGSFYDDEQTYYGGRWD